MRLGDLDEAKADFDKALDLNPRYYLALNGRGSVLWAKGDAQGAVEDFRRAVASDSRRECPEEPCGRVSGERQSGRSGAAPGKGVESGSERS